MACSKEAEVSKMKSKPLFPFVRDSYQSMRYYYPFGNSPAEDFLHHCVKTADPKVLVLGCGDLRSCFYTIWKHFNPSAPTSSKQFKSVSFTLNDYIAAIIARNVVFLALCIQLPQEDAEKKKHLCAMWAIWYCHELYPNHNKLLNSALETVVNFSSSLEQWSSQSNPLHKIVQFTSSSTLDEVAEVWKMWLFRKVQVKSKDSMLKERSMKRVKCALGENVAQKAIYLYSSPVDTTRLECGAEEASAYSRTGSCYAEEVLGIELPNETSTEANLTMYESREGKYTAHYNLFPFEGYFHAQEFTDEFFDQIKEFAKPELLVSPEKFSSKPLLANSFQQFTMWIQSTSHVLKSKEKIISFCFSHQDAVAFCLQQMMKKEASLEKKLPGKTLSFDIISTSNLIDHLGAPNILLSCIPLLDVEGILVTSAFTTRYFQISGNDYFDMCFGFSCQLHSIVMGVRCLGYEGKYSNPVFIKPSPPDLSNLYRGYNSIPRVFLWMKLPQVQKISISEMPVTQKGNITEALARLFKASCLSLLHCGQTVCTFSSTETALALMKWFISSLDGGVFDHSYWEPLGAALKESIPAFLYCIQTQMLLHGIHVHLTIDETDCPICQQTKLNGALGYFSETVKISDRDSESTYFLAYIHRLKSLKEPNELHIQAQEGNDVHIFDCFHITACEENTKLQLNFFAPLSLLKKGYYFSLCRLQKSVNFFNIARIAYPTSLASVRKSWREYQFYPFAHVLRQTTCVDQSLGRVISHQVYDGCRSETTLKLSEDALSLPTSEIYKKRVSSSTVQINWGTQSYQLDLAFPIDYKKVKVTVSKKSSVLKLSCTRQIYDLEEERPCFIASPGNQLSLVPIDLDPVFLSRHAEMQLTEEELIITNSSIDKATSLLRAKLFFKDVFFDTVAKKVMAWEIRTDLDCPKCLIVVNSLLFDYSLRTPAIYLAYCFLDSSKHFSMRNELWKLHSHNTVILPLKCLEVVKELLMHYGKRTYGAIQERGNFKALSAFGSFFTGAVLYHISIDPDEKKVSDSTKTKRSKPNCAHCNVSVHSPFMCSKCQVISYCSQRCEVLHRFLHERLCDHITKNSYTIHTHFPLLEL